MKIHEYQAKDILKGYGVPVPKGSVAETPEEARKVAERVGGKVIVVKAQIHAGGRGKGGGIRLASTLQEVEKAAKEILGKRDTFKIHCKLQVRGYEHFSKAWIFDNCGDWRWRVFLKDSCRVDTNLLELGKHPVGSSTNNREKLNW